MDSDFLPTKPKRQIKITDSTEDTGVENDQKSPDQSEESAPTDNTDTTESFDTPDDDGHESLDENPEENAPAEGAGEEQDPATKNESKPKDKKKRRSPKQWFLDLTKKQKILFIIALVIVLAGSGVGVYALTKGKPTVNTPKKQAAVKKDSKPKTEASRLTGMQISPELNKRGVTGIMIENSEDARPQSGLKDAGVVFEAIAEGGITRFLTLFQESQPDYIGPVRSVRPYYLDWVQGFDAPIVHAGGSADGLAKIKADGVKDLDQFANGNSFTRVDSRAAPHNLYTSMAQLDTLKTSKGFSTSTFTGFARKKESASKSPNARTIDLAISSSLFNVHYDYDAKTNSYLRSEGGASHTDEKSGKQLSPKVVVALIMEQGRDGVYTTYNSLGNGSCIVFQDGIVTEGSWYKGNSKDQITFKDSRGEVLKLNPGQTWLTAVGSSTAVTYQP